MALDYTPNPATVFNAGSFQSSLSTKHFVVVLPSVYGTNNSVLLDALERLNGTARGVCVIDPGNISNDTLAQFHAAGVGGVRLNIADGGDDEIIKAVRKDAAVAKVHDWVLQLWIPSKAFVSLHGVIPTLGVRFVADHFAHTEVGSKTNKTLDTIDPYRKPGFTEVIDLVQRKLLFVKLSAPYQNSKATPFYEDLRVVSETLIVKGPDMVAYGSD